jgi:hypothetical protein
MVRCYTGDFLLKKIWRRVVFEKKTGEELFSDGYPCVCDLET